MIDEGRGGGSSADHFSASGENRARVRHDGFWTAGGLVVFLIVGLMLFSEGCSLPAASASDELTIGYIEWDENVANSALIAVLAEDELGYEVELERSYLRPVFEKVSKGEVDAFLDVWMPAHGEVIEEVGGRIQLSEEPWYVGQTEFGLAVPYYMEDTQSIEDLNSSGAAMITGIEPGTLLMERIQTRVIPEYDLDLALIESSTPVMMSELEKAYARKEPFVFLAWSPHWMNVNYDFHYLEDPKHTMDEIVRPSKLHNAYRVGLEEDDPVAYALMDSMRLDKKQTSEIELLIRREGSAKDGARLWVSENPEVVQPWLDAAVAAGGTS
ncbi:glycine betaine ABC transporter substrate-binding protein [Rubrobacter indicoceani]|uniref:glycine betaine ABC transporter substrate-binding protein n=1 Tax=Rubrobacter indicoceani TaxID=2051957 RepID=UPI000E5C188C|nr:glycine betaine ABC transporter substrate-binding protein [Rubrobacter indicoceani]